MKYDAVVIGAGHNGLTTAGYLAQSGLKVIVLERRHVVGGCAVTLKPRFSSGFARLLASASARSAALAATIPAVRALSASDIRPRA